MSKEIDNLKITSRLLSKEAESRGWKVEIIKPTSDYLQAIMRAEKDGKRVCLRLNVNFAHSSLRIFHCFRQISDLRLFKRYRRIYTGLRNDSWRLRRF